MQTKTVYAAGAALVTLVSDLIVLFQLSLTDAQKGALAGAITTLTTIGVLVYEAWHHHADTKVQAAAVTPGGNGPTPIPRPPA